VRQGGHTQIENTGGAGTGYRTSSQITGRENIWIRFVDATTDAVGPLLDGGHPRHGILVFSIANFCQATAAAWHALISSALRAGQVSEVGYEKLANTTFHRILSTLLRNFAIVRWSLETDVDGLGL
jgi:hypothetical protein